MATRQYIGARYVIKIYENSQSAGSADWEANTSYEPLTMVTYQNSSYLSKKAVPPTVGNPTSNPQYWAIMGYYSGQIATLQEQVNSLNDVVTALTSAVGKKQTKVYNKAIIVGDSWAVGYYSGEGHEGQGWGDYACPLLGISSDNILNVGSGGSGFCNGTGEHFDAQIARAYTNYPAFRDADIILCVGGFNDAQDEQTYSAVKAAAGSFFENCKNYFPNAEVHMFPLQLPYEGSMSIIREGVLEGIKTAFFNETTGNLFLHEGIHTWANEYGAGASAGDGSHLNQYGYAYMGQKIAELVRNGGNYYPHLHGTIDLSAWASYIDDTQLNQVYECEGITYIKLAVHVNSLPISAKAQLPWFAKVTENHFIHVDSTAFLTLNTTGIYISEEYSGWIMIDKAFPAGMY